MSRISHRFDALRAEKRSALITFVTAGDPGVELTVPMMHSLAAAGADVIELGVPFSDPMADGPVIQRASERALEHHTSLRQVLEMVAEFRGANDHTPVVLMGYANPVEVMGYDVFAREAAGAGVDGVLTVDLPPEEAEALGEALRGQGVDPIFLLAPTSDEQRIRTICDQARGFVYYVSLKGVTGAASLNVEEVAGRVARIRQHTELPVGVGFGISDPETAARVGQVADAVIVGSALVRQVEELAPSRSEEIPQVLGTLVAAMRSAMDQANPG